MGKKRQKSRRQVQARRESMRRHPSFVEVDCPPPLWAFPTFVYRGDGPCPICQMLGIEVDHLGIHDREELTGENVPVQREGQASLARPPLDQSPAVTGEIYVEDVS